MITNRIQNDFPPAVEVSSAHLSDLSVTVRFSTMTVFSPLPHIPPSKSHKALARGVDFTLVGRGAPQDYRGPGREPELLWRNGALCLWPTDSSVFAFNL